jgi:hypothetical protein
MNIVNTIFLITGIIVALIGLGAILNPNIARIINAPGGPRLKALIAIIIGIIFVIISFIIEIPME